MLVIFQTNASAMASVIIQLADLCLCSARVIWRTSVFVTFTNKTVSVLRQLGNEDELVNFRNFFLWVRVKAVKISLTLGKHAVKLHLSCRKVHVQAIKLRQKVSKRILLDFSDSI